MWCMRTNVNYLVLVLLCVSERLPVRVIQQGRIGGEENIDFVALWRENALLRKFDGAGIV